MKKRLVAFLTAMSMVFMFFMAMPKTAVNKRLK